MNPTVITPPRPIILAEAMKDHLRVFNSDDDQLIEGYIAAATAVAQSWLGRALGVQVLEFQQDCLQEAANIRLPFGPVVSVESFSYLDTDAAPQTVSPERYVLFGEILCRAPGATWPVTGRFPGAVRIRYQTGQDTVAAEVLAAIKVMVADLYAQRESIVTGTIASAVPLSLTVERLLAPSRVINL